MVVLTLIDSQTSTNLILHIIFKFLCLYGMSDYSKIITALPILVGLLIVGLDFVTGFEVTESQIDLIEFLIGTTVVGGVANAGYKRYVAYKSGVKPVL